MLVLSFHKSLSDAANVCVGNLFNSFCSSNVYPSKPICPSKPVCLNSVRPSKSIILKNFNLSKPVCPGNITFSRSIRSSNVCQNRINFSPNNPVRKPVCKHVCPSNVLLK